MRASPQPPGESLLRTILRWMLALAYLAAGILHIASPEPFIGITPGWVPAIPAVVTLTGIAEILGAIGLLQSRSARLRRAAGIGLACYAICVFPANINHMIIDMSSAQPQLGWSYHIPRMFLQPVLIWLALWTGGVIHWPFQRSR